MSSLLATTLAVTLTLSPAPQADGPGTPAVAQATLAQPGGPTKVQPLRHSWLWDGALTGAAAAAWFSTETVFKHQLAPQTCRLWCETTVNPIDEAGRAVRWAPGSLSSAALTSDVLVYGALPVAMLGLDWYLAATHGAPGEVLTDALLIAEAVALAQVVNQSVKFVVGRERPYYHVLGEADRLADPKREDAIMSFFSGHTTFAFSITFATATVTALRGYEGAWLVWAVGLPLAVAVPYFRMAADRHYLSDVAVGALTGALFGWGIPTLHGRDTGAGAPKVTLLPTSNGAAVVGVF